jgi:hypothetical protein
LTPEDVVRALGVGHDVVDAHPLLGEGEWAEVSSAGDRLAPQEVTRRPELKIDAQARAAHVREHLCHVARPTRVPDDPLVEVLLGGGVGQLRLRPAGDDELFPLGGHTARVHGGDHVGDGVGCG